jgi:hypothetical protein
LPVSLATVHALAAALAVVTARRVMWRVRAAPRKASGPSASSALVAAVPGDRTAMSDKYRQRAG